MYSTSQAKIMYRPDVCNRTMPYVPRNVPAYAVRDPAYTAEVFALTLIEIYVIVTDPGLCDNIFLTMYSYRLILK